MPNTGVLLAEISREKPEQFKHRTGFVIQAYGCSVFEEWVGKSVVYTAVNNKSGKSERIDRRPKELPNNEKQIADLVRKVRNSRISGLGRLEVAEGVAPAKLKAIVNAIFREILPKHGYKIREEQIALAHELLDALTGRKTLLAEAPTGLGKSIVIAIVGLLVRRSEINKTWSGGYFPGMSCVEWQRMPVLVSTSSIALQTALQSEVIPELSEILMEWGVIREPITSVLRKGRSHHVCEYNLGEYLPFVRDNDVRKELEWLRFDTSVIDLAEVDSLTADVKKKISVPARCYKNCPYSDECRYRAFRQTVSKTGYDFVICNHNLLLRDAILRAEGKGQTLPPFQCLILDESHTFLKVARDMYGAAIAKDAIPAVTDTLRKMNFAPLALPKTDGWKVVRDAVCKLADKLYKNNKRLFSRENADENCDRSLRNIRDITDQIHKHLSATRVLKVERDEQLKHSMLWELQRISDAANELFDGNGTIRWFETDDEAKTAIGGIPKRLNEYLYDDLWGRGIPTMLTSGTLSVAGDFTELKHSLGLDNKNIRLSEATHASPFNYKENCLLYLSKNVPDYREDGYINKLTDEIERLIRASNGHAAVLFTSYKSMRSVHSRLKDRNPKMKDFVLERSSSTAIDKFKASGNGVLFACGSMWTGIDCPGDILSMLVIVKLPFGEPDAIREYERSQYPSLGAYIREVLTPEMLLLLRQGHGRGFRTEKDTCVVAILDIRASEGQTYNRQVVAALPKCGVTSDLTEVADFFKAKKQPDYFT
jgi:ATP-dependent DNA helicase DinG